MNIKELVSKIDNKRKKIILIISIITIIAIIIYILNLNNLEEDFLINSLEENIFNNEIENNIKESNLIENNINENKQNIEAKQKIIIHIDGEVLKKGIVEIEEGQRIIDAIEKAGGTTAQADLSKINLAYILEDGQKVYIPKINENYTESYVTDESGLQESINTTNGQKETSKKTNKKVNINTASLEELQNLQGIGESIAKRIIEYRKQNGKFSNIEEIKNVSGIGESKFNKIKEYICI